MEQKIILTRRQKWAYAHWSMKGLFLAIPAFFVCLFYMGLILWMAQPYVDGYIQNPPEHWLFWQVVARFICGVGSLFLGWVTVYAVMFLWYFFFDKDEVLQQHFMKYHYKKKNIWTL